MYMNMLYSYIIQVFTMLSRSLIFFMLLADLSFHGHEDTVHLSMYSPLILFNRENILFASSPMSCTVSKEGTFTISLLLLKGIKRERIKRVLLILLVTLLLQCGDIENNPGPLDGKYIIVLYVLYILPTHSPSP